MLSLRSEYHLLAVMMMMIAICRDELHITTNGEIWQLSHATSTRDFQRVKAGVALAPLFVQFDENVLSGSRRVTVSAASRVERL